jgi:hypothetical protein
MNGAGLVEEEIKEDGEIYLSIYFEREEES